MVHVVLIAQHHGVAIRQLDSATTLCQALCKSRTKQRTVPFEFLEIRQLDESPLLTWKS